MRAQLLENSVQQVGPPKSLKEATAVCFTSHLQRGHMIFICLVLKQRAMQPLWKR